MRIGLVIGILVAVVLLSGVTLAASAKLDTPSQTVSVEEVIDAPRKDVFATLSDLDSYDEWNPYVTHASGDVRVGGELRLRLAPPGAETENVTVKVLTLTGRKLRWEDRLVLPGVRDQEVTLRLVELSDSRVRLVETVRMEGLLAPWADLEATRSGLELMAEALERRTEG
jgi:uncharacterized protein YndB with AHSA1/START domain